MRKLAFLTFATYVSILLAPLSFASSGVDITKPCIQDESLDLTQDEWTAVKSGSGKTYNPNYDSGHAKLTTYYSSIEEKSLDNVENKYCGLPRDETHMYEKGDCSYGTDIQLITEISEPIGGAVSSESTGGEGQVINLYKGICCQALSTDKSYCDSTKSVYFDSYANCDVGAEYCQKIQWLISKTGAGIIKTYVKQIYVYGAGIVGFLAVAVIVGSGIQISVSGASGDITAAKDRIIQSLMGIALLFLSALILYTINPTFFN